MAGLKKETKKLSKTLKTHRKRLESLLAVTQHAVAVPSCGSAVPQLSQAELHAVLSEIAQLQTALAAVRQQKRQLAAMCDCDSSDSDSDDEPKRKRSSLMTMQPMQQMEQLQRCSSPVAVAAVSTPTAADATSSSSSMGSVCLQVPLVDQEHPDVCQQLPPPLQYTTTGRVLVCQGKACMRKGALQVLQAASHATAASPGVEVLPCKCLGKCKQGPAMRVRTEQQQRSSLVTEVEALEVSDILDQLLA